MLPMRSFGGCVASLSLTVASCGGGPGVASTSVEPSVCATRLLRDVQSGHDLLPGYDAERDPRVADWIAALGTDALSREMQGMPIIGDPNYADIDRSLDVPLGDGNVLRGYLYRYGSRGVNLDSGQINRDQTDGNNFATAFPAESMRGASFDLELEWELGEAVGDETMASGNNLVRGLEVDLVRHPYWGGAQDAYGEDAYHSGRMGSAFTAGVQTHVGACAEHWAAYSVEHGRFDANSIIDEQTLREIYGRPFEMVVRDGGIACIVAADNSVNGERATTDAHLLRDILKGEVARGGFGFRGFAVTNLFASPAGQVKPSEPDAGNMAAQMANAGLDVELPFTLLYADLPTVVADGRVAPQVITDAASRILEQKARFGSALTTDPYGLGSSSSTLSGSSIATNLGHLELAERAERESAVLLDNGPEGEPTLPIPRSVRTVAVVGGEVPFDLASSSVPKSCNDGLLRHCTFHFATDVALGDRGSNRVNADPAESIGPFAGIRSTATLHSADVVQGSTAADATNADFVVVVVGLTPGDEGEEYTVRTLGDRSSLDLPADQATLVANVLALGKPTAIVVESGSIVNLPWLSDPNRNQATIWAGYGGMRAGAALGELLFGDANFSGKMPLAWPSESALPPFRGDGNDTVMSYFFGYRDYDRRQALGESLDVVFPFGHGLSYTTFAYSHASLPCAETKPDAVVDVTFDIENTGTADGDEVAFLFVQGPAPVSLSDARPVRELKGFARVHVAHGTTEHVDLPLRIQDLRHWTGGANGSSMLDPGAYRVLVGPRDAEDALLPAGEFLIAG